MRQPKLVVGKGGLPPLGFEGDPLSSGKSGGKPETWKWFRLKGVRNPSGKV